MLEIIHNSLPKASIQNFNNKYESVDDQFNDFYWRLEGCAALKKLKSKEIKLQNKPWISDRIMKMINIRSKLFAHKKIQPAHANTKNFIICSEIESTDSYVI